MEIAEGERERSTADDKGPEMDRFPCSGGQLTDFIYLFM